MVRVAHNPKPCFTVSLRLPQPGEPGSRIYIPQEQGGPVIPPGTGMNSSEWQLPYNKHVLQSVGLLTMLLYREININVATT
jgi:hypothetical protein